MDYQSNNSSQMPNDIGYYSQPAKKEPHNSFATASVILGICSLVMLCTGVFSIPLGAMGILLAVLSRRARKMSSVAKTGCTISCFGLCGGIIITILAYLVLIITAMDTIDFSNISPYDTDAYTQKIMENLYGPDYQEFFESTYGIDYNSYMDIINNMIGGSN